MNFIDRLKTYDKNTVSDNIIRKLKLIINKPEFDPTYIGKKLFIYLFYKKLII